MSCRIKLQMSLVLPAEEDTPFEILCECDSLEHIVPIKITLHEHRKLLSAYPSKNIFILHPSCTISPEDTILFQCAQYVVIHNVESLKLSLK